MLNILTPRNTTAHGDHTNKSTGPKTPEGKAASKMNALKHGLLSKEVLVQCYTHRESEEEFMDLHQRFMSELNPVGPLEEALVDQIVTAQWRLRRVLAAEAGEIAHNLDQSAEVLQQLEGCKQALLWSKAEDPSVPMTESAEGCRLLQKYFKELRTKVEQAGTLTQEMLDDWTNQRFEGKKISFVKDFEGIIIPMPEDLPEEIAVKVRAGFLATVLKALEMILMTFATLEERHKEKESCQKLSRTSASVLPSPEALEKIGRYESRLNRQLFRAIKELRSLQAERRKSDSEVLRNEPNRQNTMADQSKTERSPRSESRSENLRNEPIAQSAVQGSEFKVQSSEELRNEPISTMEASEISDLRAQMDGNLPNEAAEEGAKSEEPRILPNEPTVEIGNEEPRIKH